MKRTDLPKRLQLMLEHMPYVTIATTCSDGRPWNTPVVGYFDDSLNLYWSSDTLSQHSKNIAHNTRVFVVVYDTSLPLGEGVGLYLQMSARRLSKPAEIEAAKKIYLDRYGEEEPGHQAFTGSCPRRIYRAQPLRVSSNNSGIRRKHFIDVREQLLPTAK